MISSTKGKLAVEPFPDQSVKTKAEGEGEVKVGRIEQTKALVRLQLVFRGNTVATAVYVSPEHFRQPYATKVYELNGKKFIVIPESIVELEEWDNKVWETL